MSARSEKLQSFFSRHISSKRLNLNSDEDRDMVDPPREDSYVARSGRTLDSQALEHLEYSRYINRV